MKTKAYGRVLLKLSGEALAGQQGQGIHNPTIKQFASDVAEAHKLGVQIGIVIGGPYNSGILATGPKPGAFYNYAPAPPAILQKVRAIEALCKAHGVKLAEAALRFALSPPAVVSVIPGGQKPGEVRRNAETVQAKIPPALWRDLKAQALVRADSPTPR